jgi:hypothetical protein
MTAAPQRTMSNPPGCKTQLYKRHVLADSGINLIHQRTIAVERFAVLDFRWFLANARLQSGGLDIVQILNAGEERKLFPQLQGICTLGPGGAGYA